jgi:hypothetical protein
MDVANLICRLQASGATPFSGRATPTGDCRPNLNGYTLIVNCANFAGNRFHKLFIAVIDQRDQSAPVGNPANCGGH